MDFDGKFQKVVGVRNQKFDSVQNFRDIGGYENKDLKSVKWGKVYRSGSLNNLGDIDKKRIQLMKINSYLDLSTNNNDNFPLTNISFKNQKQYKISCNLKNPSILIYNNKFKYGDAVIFVQDVYRGFVDNNRDTMKSIFKLLLEEDNYPVIFCCNLGVYQTSYAVAMLMSALDIPENTIIDEYKLNNRYLKFRQLKFPQESMTEEIQKVMTAMLYSDEKYMRGMFNYIRANHGDINNFLKSEYGIDEIQKTKLKSILME